MLRRPAILGGIALLGAGIAAFVLARRGDDLREHSTFERKGERRPGRETGDGTEDGTTATAVLTPLERRGWTLRGRLVRYPDPDALEPTQPVAGALVRIALGKDSGEPRPDFAPREVRSGTDGRYAFEGVPGKAEYRVDVDAEGCALRAVGFELPDVQDATTKEIPEIVLDEPVRFVVILKGPGGALRGDGRVRASRSDFPPHSRLREEKLEAERRSPGEHVFERASRGEWQVSAWAPGCVEQREEILLPRGPREMVLEPGFRFSGAVRSLDGRPIEGAEVRVERPVPERRVRTGPDGGFAIEDLREGTCEVSATAAGFGRTSREMESGLEDIELVLLPEGVIAGRVIDAETEEPLRAARIVRRGKTLATTDARGSFEIRGLDAGAYELQADHDDYVTGSADPVTVDVGERVDGIELRLEKGVAVKGRVLSVGGRVPLAGAEVSVARSRGKSDSRRHAVTVEDGSFSVSGLAEADYLVWIRSKEHLTLTARAKAPGTVEEWTFAVLEGGFIAGRVLDPDGHPFPGVSVHAFCSADAPAAVQRALDDPDPHPHVTNHEGRYRIGPLHPFDSYWLLFRDDDGRRYLPVWREGILVAAGQEARISEARFRRGQVLRGRAMDTAGVPLAGVTIVVATHDDVYDAVEKLAEGTPFSRSSMNPPRPRARTGPNGEYRIDNLVPGHYTLWAQMAGRVMPSHRTVEIRDGSELEHIDFVFPAGGTVSGRVIDGAGSPIEGVEVSADPLVSAGASTTTDPEGRFAIQGLKPGRCVLVAEKTGYARQSISCGVPSDGSVISLPALATISGRIVTAGSEKPPVCIVTVTSPGEFLTEATSDVSGRFALTAPPGGCEVYAASRNGHLIGRLKLSLESGERRDIFLRLEETGDISITVESDPETLPESAYMLLEHSRADMWPVLEFLSGGECSFEGVLPGTVRIAACLPGRGVATVEDVQVVPGDTTEVTVPLPQTQGAFGIVTRAGVPVEGVRVQARWPQGSAETRNRAGGLYELRELAPGRCELVFEGMGSGRPVRRSVHVPEGGSMSLDVDMDNARVWGTITSAGEPVPKALILFESDSGELVTSNPTTEDGAWSLELPAPHGYTLQVYRDGQALGAPRALDLSSADEVRVDIETEKN